MTEVLIDRPPELHRLGRDDRHVQDGDAARCQHPSDLVERPLVVHDVFEHIAAYDQTEDSPRTGNASTSDRIDTLAMAMSVLITGRPAPSMSDRRQRSGATDKHRPAPA